MVMDIFVSLLLLLLFCLFVRKDSPTAADGVMVGYSIFLVPFFRLISCITMCHDVPRKGMCFYARSTMTITSG